MTKNINEMDIKKDMMKNYIDRGYTLSSGMTSKETVFVRPDDNTAFLIDHNRVYRAIIEDNKIVEFKELS